MIKKALVVGINHYFNQIECLNGCVKDAQNMTELLSTTYSEKNRNLAPNFSCKLLTSNANNKSPMITRALLKKEIKSLFEDKQADVVLFYFSGHGFENNLGGYLVTQDTKTYDEGISFNHLITYANTVKKEVVIILDCCRSGNLGDVTISKNQFSKIREGVGIMTASTSAQNSWDTQSGGVFTQLICNALKGGSADLFGNISFNQMYRFAERNLGAWEQRPTLKSNLNKSVIIRTVEPKIARATIAKIVDYFPTPQHKFQLDPAFEPTENCGETLKEHQFSELQTMANNGIVKPVDENHMYYAAIYSKKCELTLLGKRYWDIIKQGKNVN